MTVPAEAVKDKDGKVCCLCGTRHDLVVNGTMPGPRFTYICRECEKRRRRGW